jgi:hypothetical protein
MPLSPKAVMSLPSFGSIAAMPPSTCEKMRGPTPLPPGQYSGPRRAVPVVSYFQICWPVAASSANTPFCALKYMTPSTTSRPLSKKPESSPVWNVQARFRFLTLSTLI